MTHSLADTSQALARELRRSGGYELPATLDEVIGIAEQTEGVRLGELITALQPDPQAAATVLAQTLQAAADTDPGHDIDIRGHLRQWQPVIALAAAAAGGDPGAAAELVPGLNELAQTNDWGDLVAVLRRIVDGERGYSLLEGLDPIDTAIAAEILAKLSS